MANNKERDLAAISVSPHSRFPGHNDYNQRSHAYSERYVHPNGYQVRVSACRSLVPLIDPKAAEDFLKEIERERHFEPRSGDEMTRPSNRDPTVNIGGRMKVPSDIVAWNWTLEDSKGKVVDRTQRRANLGTEACGATLVAPSLGRYRVNLRLERTGRALTSNKWVDIRNDYLIVSIGESYASGQGVPDKSSHPLPNGSRSDPVWVEPKAHRSFQSGPALAAKSIEKPGEGDLVTFLSFASSGATIDKGLLGPQHSWQNGGQIEEVERAVGDRPIDILLLSIGGNDVGFASGLKELLYRIDKSQSQTFKETEQRINSLIRGRDGQKAKFDQLAESIKRLNPKHVLITEYPLAHFDRKDDGTVGRGCGWFNLDPLDRLTPFNSDKLTSFNPEGSFRSYRHIRIKITESDARLMKRIGKMLNQAVQKAAEDHGWTYVSGIVEGFQGGGYCRSDKRYFIQYDESKLIQGDREGTMHPNRKGQQIYADKISAALQRTLRERNVSDHSEEGKDSEESGQKPIFDHPKPNWDNSHNLDRYIRKDIDRVQRPPTGKGIDDWLRDVHRK